MSFNITLDTKDFERVLKKLERQSKKEAESMLQELGDALLLLSRQEAPLDEGTLIKTSRTYKNSTGQQVVEYSQPYAAFQHEGIRKDGTHKVTKYQNGRKKKYLEDPLKENITKWTGIMKDGLERAIKRAS